MNSFQKVPYQRAPFMTSLSKNGRRKGAQWEAMLCVEPDICVYNTKPVEIFQVLPVAERQSTDWFPTCPVWAGSDPSDTAPVSRSPLVCTPGQ